jgi:hypothetical protein
MCGFGCTIDLVKMVFYFSCKNESSKVYTCFFRSCSSSHIEHNKISFAIFGFFYDFIWILQVTGSKGKTWRIYFYPSPWKDLKPHTTTLGFCTQVPKRSQSSHVYPSAAGRALRTWTANCTGLPECSSEIDWWRRWGRSDLRRWPAARQWWHGCHGSGSGAI